MEATAHVPEPALHLRDAVTPVSATFDDVYFSRAGGIAETDHVFLRGNQLPARWQGRSRFTIGELGFGTGLNFLVARQRFCATADAGAVLHYLSVEKYPFTVDTLTPLLALYPELREEAEALLAAYPLRLPGIHRIHLPRVVLTLALGDVAEMLPQWPAQAVDAWFLDGFSPAKNPEMWHPSLLAELARLSAPGATLATFTSAGQVRRDLAAAGFTMRKLPGFGHKRDMLAGERAPTPACPAAPAAAPHTACVLGAGIAGATLARALAERGWRVTVLERGTVAGGASGNAAGVLFPQLTKRWNPSAAWYFTAYGFALRAVARWRQQGLIFAGASPGMLRLPRHAEEEAQLQAIGSTLALDPAIVHWLSRDEASATAGLELRSGAAFFPQGSWISPPQLCQALLDHPLIMLREHTAVARLTRAGEAWQLTLASGEVISTPICCVAAAVESSELLADYGIRLGQVGGQVSEFLARDVAAPLRSILCHKGYLIPYGERYLTGATYHREALTDVTAARHQENAAELAAMLPGWLQGSMVAGRSAVRATTPDRLPYIGRVDAGLYVSTGHGSRGMLSAPLAAEIIASSLAGEASPVSAPLAQAVAPGRFRKG